MTAVPPDADASSSLISGQTGLPASATNHAGTDSAGKVTGWNQLARRMSSRTTDLLAMAIILIAGLGLGHQILEWWRAEPSEAAGLESSLLPSENWGTNDRPVELNLGDSPWRLIRQTVTTGGEPAALDVLRNRCRTLLQQPPDKQLPRTAGIELTSELRAVLSRLEPEVSQPGDWRIYLLDQFPRMVLGIRDGQTPDASRLVCWGLVLHSLGGGWTTCCFEPSETPSMTASSELAKLALPHGGRRVLAMSEPGQGGLIHWTGTGSLDEWQQHLEQELARLGWGRLGDWNATDHTSSARFGQQSEHLEIQIQAQGEEVTAILSWISLLQKKSQPAETVEQTD